MSTLDVVAEVLREVAPQALKARQIAALAGARLPSASRTPATVVSRDLAIDVRDRGATSRFLRVGRGEFVLKEALSTAFYNDTDAYAAQWTRNLIAAGEIAAGDVDERSIRDLQPADVASYRQCHFFSGLGIWSRVLRDAGWPDDVNVWSGSAPCQPWSSAGRRKGHDDDRDLWPEWFRLIAACRPTVVIGEQVSSKDGLVWLDSLFDDLEKEDYACQAFDLPACSVGAPHKRQRFYWAAYARERGREVLGQAWLHDRVLGDAGLARGGRDAGALPGAEGAGSGERVEAGDLAHEPVASGADHGAYWEGAVRGFWGLANWVYCRPAPGHKNGRWRPVEPVLIKMADGSPFVVGPLRPEEVDEETIGTAEADAAQVLRCLWPEAGAQALPRGLGRFDQIQAAEVLRPALHGPWHGWNDQSFECAELAEAEREAGGGVLFPLRSFRHAALCASSGRKSTEQHAVEPSDLVRLLSSSFAFAQLRSDDRTAEALQALLEACGAERLMSRPSGEASEVWRSLTDADKGRLLVRLGEFRRASISPLVSTPKGNNRAAKLRGYGNSIVLPLAAAFVGAVIDALVDAAQSRGDLASEPPRVVVAVADVAREEDAA